MTTERKQVSRSEDRTGDAWLADYNQQTVAAIKLRLIGEREAALRAMPSEPTVAEQLAWLAREREDVVKQIGTE